MRALKQAVFLLIFTVFCGLATQAYAATVIVTDSQFYDPERDRYVPFRLYAPSPVASPAPVIIFSHGLGGSIEAAPYLGDALASEGYMTFFIQHPGSDREIWRGLRDAGEVTKALRQSIRNPNHAIDRYKDLTFVINELIAAHGDRESPLFRKLDLRRIGMAGHSYGARSVMMAAGEQTPFGGPVFKDPRVRAAIALSPDIPDKYIGKSDEEIATLYTDIEIPIFHITGTEDGHPFHDGFDPVTRTLPYKNIKTPHQYLLVLDGAEHSTFGGSVRKGKVTDAGYQQTVAEAAVMFFNAYLMGDTIALSDLRQGFRKKLSPMDRFEYK